MLWAQVLRDELLQVARAVKSQELPALQQEWRQFRDDLLREVKEILMCQPFECPQAGFTGCPRLSLSILKLCRRVCRPLQHGSQSQRQATSGKSLTCVIRCQGALLTPEKAPPKFLFRPGKLVEKAT